LRGARGGRSGREVPAAAVGACLRKPPIIAYGVLKSRTPFDPDRASRKAP
jgi:hypothetical protein